MQQLLFFFIFSTTYFPSFTNAIVDDNGEDAGDSTTTSSPPTINESKEIIVKCEEEEVEEITLITIFTDWQKVLLGLIIAAILTAPASSVYFRKTTVKPMKSYLYSCIVKYIATFFSASILATIIAYDGRRGGHKYIENCIMDEGTAGESAGQDISFLAAIYTETVEFLFDFGRLVICFVDPGTIDFYHNVRWNSNVSARHRCKVGFISLLMALLVCIMWIFNSMALWFSIFTGGEDNFFQKNIVAKTGSFGTMLSIILYLYTTASMFVGVYYLIRMLCPCFNKSGNQGEENGIGYFWSRFKLIAIDSPSLIILLLTNPSSLVFFWTAEFVNDIFPTVAMFFLERVLLKEGGGEGEEKVEIE